MHRVKPAECDCIAVQPPRMPVRLPPSINNEEITMAAKKIVTGNGLDVQRMLGLSVGALAQELWKADPKLRPMLQRCKGARQAREELFEYFNSIERAFNNVYSRREVRFLHPIEKNNAKHCARVLKNIIRTEYELAAGTSALGCLLSLSRGEYEGISRGFACEMVALFSGLNGKSGMYARGQPKFMGMEGRAAALERSSFLDEYADMMEKGMARFKSGLHPKLAAARKRMKERIMRHFGATEKDWQNYRWHYSHAITDASTLKRLVALSPEEEEGVKLAEESRIPFQITPYYLSLFLPESNQDADRAVRAQVLPSPRYCTAYMEAREKGASLDFMGEGSTSPVECITRRYPEIVIIKPYDSCPQICVYCQRNWEIKRACEAKISRGSMARAIGWIRKNRHIREVLVTGGDPLTLSDSYIEWVVGSLARIPHVLRIRIGTRTLVTAPFRITPTLVSILEKYLEPGKRDICVVTHVEHPAELTKDMLVACTRLRKAGISIYNQQVFTYFNSRRLETCALRRGIKLFGIDPYYSFNTKGKEETEDFRVPIARLSQERKEEARLLPGLERTDEPVFNVPRLGKSHLRAWQDHELIMVKPDGRRVYRFYPWESKLELVPPYDYADVPIYEYLRRLDADGEDVGKYRTIWYYF